MVTRRTLSVIRHFVRLAAFVVFLMVGASAAFGQETATILGTVKDASGAAVAGAPRDAVHRRRPYRSGRPVRLRGLGAACGAQRRPIGVSALICIGADIDKHVVVTVESEMREWMPSDV